MSIEEVKKEFFDLDEYIDWYIEYNDDNVIYRNGNIELKFNYPFDILIPDIVELIKCTHKNCVKKLESFVENSKGLDIIKSMVNDNKFLTIKYFDDDIIVDVHPIKGLDFTFVGGYEYDLDKFSKWIDNAKYLYNLYLDFKTNIPFECSYTAINIKTLHISILNNIELDIMNKDEIYNIKIGNKQFDKKTYKEFLELVRI
jgi:hypothetical protein